MRIEWENLGIYGAAEVHDLWLRRDLGVLTVSVRPNAWTRSLWPRWQE